MGTVTNMMKHLSTLLMIATLGIAGSFIIPFAYKVSKSNAQHADLATVQGEIAGANQSFVLIKFEEKIITGCGDATVLGFLTSPDGKNILQLKPIILPQSIASKTEKTLLYPISDIAGLINQSGDWKLTLFVKNNCSILDNKLVELPPMTFKVNPAKPPISQEKF